MGLVMFDHWVDLFVALLIDALHEQVGYNIRLTIETERKPHKCSYLRTTDIETDVKMSSKIVVRTIIITLQ